MVSTNLKKKAHLIFNSYKNANKLGTQKIEIPNELRNVLLKWKDKNPYDWLVVNRNGGTIKQSKLTTILNSVFQKKISSSLLRHIYLTAKFGNVDLQDLQDTATAMGSSDIKTTLQYVQKENAKDNDD